MAASGIFGQVQGAPLSSIILGYAQPNPCSSAQQGGRRAARTDTTVAPRTVPEIGFKDALGRKRTFADLRDKVLTLNIWATRCPPCREEMPALDRLQPNFETQSVVVVALSVDRKGLGAVQRFFDESALEQLVPFIDESRQTVRNLSFAGLPGTLLIDPDGQEFGRLLGGAKWDSKEIIEFLKAQVEHKGDLHAHHQSYQ
jgi:thiol-disulfide isomerase/thioredoxin